MNYVGLFEGISGFGLAFKRAGANILAVCEIELNRNTNRFGLFFNQAKFGSFKDSLMRQAMAVWAKDYAVINSEFAALALLNNMMSVATRLIPAATHADIGIHSAHSEIPRAFIGVLGALADRVRLALIPRSLKPIGLHSFYSGANLSLALFLVLMSGNVFSGAATCVCRLSFLSASTSTNNQTHKTSLPRKEYITFSRNGGIL